MDADERKLTQYPEAWQDRISCLSGSVALNVAGYSVDVAITSDELEYVYFPLLALLENAAQQQRRILAGLAGVGGGGKSVFAAILSLAARELFPAGYFVVVGMDGWHWPNAVLDARTTTDEAGNVIPLRRRKGGPESYDVRGLVDALRRLKRGDVAVPLPVYDRQRHEPVENGITVLPQSTIVLVEGNYLLSRQPPWQDVSGLLNPKIYLDCDLSTARERIIARHVRGGLSREEAIFKFETNDRINTDVIMGTRVHTDIIVNLSHAPVLFRNPITKARKYENTKE